MLQRIARTNKRPAPSLKRLQDVAAATSLASQQRKQYSYWHLFSSCRMAVNTLIIVYAWFVSSAVYYGMSFNVTFLEGSTYLNFFLLGLAEIPAIVFVVLVNNWLGRRKTVSLLMVLAGVSCAVIVLMHLLCNSSDSDGGSDVITLIVAVVGKFGIAGAWAAAQVFSAELFPTVVRNIGIGACSMAARVGGVMAPAIVEASSSSSSQRASLTWLPYAGFGCCACVSGVLSCCLPETLNQPLPDTLAPRGSGGGGGCCGAQKDVNEASDDVAQVTYQSASVDAAGDSNGAVHLLNSTSL